MSYSNSLSNEELKRLKEYMGIYVPDWNGFNLRTLLARLEASERVCEAAILVKETSMNGYDQSCKCSFCSVLKNRIKDWRKACGK